MQAVEEYGKVSFGPGYLKKLEIRLNIIDKRLETNLSFKERKELVEQKEKIDKEIRVISGKKFN